MAGLTFNIVFPKLSDTRIVIADFLDQPAEEFVKDSTIETILKRSYNTVFNQTTIDTVNIEQVKDVIHALTVFHVFGAYMNSMSDNLQDTNKFEFMNKLAFYKRTAIGLGNLLGIDVSGEKIILDTTMIIAGGTGVSNLKDTTHFDGAAGNINV